MNYNSNVEILSIKNTYASSVANYNTVVDLSNNTAERHMEECSREFNKSLSVK